MGSQNDVSTYLRQNRPELLRILSDLLECRTLGPGSEIDRAFDLVVRELKSAGIEAQIVTNSQGIPTLLATVDSGQSGQHLLLQGHMDVVPVESDWKTDPFRPVIEDGTLYARGTCDMKAGLASFIVLLKALKITDGLTRGSVTLLIDADEETGSENGLIPYIEEYGLKGYDAAICAEPTSMRPYLGNRGLLWAEISIAGVASHAGMPHAGKNPVPVLANLIGQLPDPPEMPGLYGGTGPSITPTVIAGGEVVNSIASEATVLVDRRIVPPEEYSSAKNQLEKFVESFAKQYPDFPIKLSFIKEWPACLINEGAPIAQAARDVAKKFGRDDSFGFDDACNDASFLSEAGVPTLIWGPGKPEMAHVSDEAIQLEELYVAPEMYFSALQHLDMGAKK